MTRVLIADNNVELCRILKEFLARHEDLDVVGVVHNGEDALKEIETLNPDVVILDITMPQLDGIAVMERLSSLQLERLPKIIVLTAFAKDDMVHRMMALGADYFVVKPFDLDLLVDRIREFGPNGTNDDSEMEPRRVREHPGSRYNARPEVVVSELLNQMGIPPHFKGYTYLREAILMVSRDDRLLGGGLTKELYPRLAEKYGSSPGGVEAAIRNAIMSAWEKGNKEFLQSVVGSNLHSRDHFPTNSLIIARLADKLKLETRAS